MAQSYKGKVFSSASSIFKSADRRLSIKKATQAHTNAMNALFSDAIHVFVRTAVSDMLVDTGMSVSSFKALVNAIGMLPPQKLAGVVKLKEMGTAESAISKAENKIRTSSRKGYTDIDGKWIPTGHKSAGTGESLGRKAYTIDYANPNNGIVSFRFEAVVYQHAKLMSESLNKGAEAMEMYINENISNYVNPAKFLKLVLNIQV